MKIDRACAMWYIESSQVSCSITRMEAENKTLQKKEQTMNIRSNNRVEIISMDYGGHQISIFESLFD